ncbi:MAG: HAMP domain-containing histidine kinase [Leptolyngbya sp. SIO3F4]|nr:HAMP domain-containing histidine kinase [Leptolyngbya sp. SIO3F4]
MTLTETEETIRQLKKQNRILAKQLKRSETDRAKLEDFNRDKEFILKRIIGELQESQTILEKKSQDLEQTLQELTLTQSKLVEAEKMAALGGLVAGVAHEINTPIGTSITLASTLSDETKALVEAMAEGQLKRSRFQNYLKVAQQCAALLFINLDRAGQLVQSFKQVAVDQASLEQRTFLVKPYLMEVITSLSPHLKNTHHQIELVGDDTITLTSYPGAIAQIVTNLVTNSLNHAYGEQDHGRIALEVYADAHQLQLQYSDDGCGISEQNLPKIFEPFFTTARNQGGTGLGLHIVYNLVTQNLQGQISVHSQTGQGTRFDIELPIHPKKE